MDQRTKYEKEETSKYSKISLKGEGTLYLSFRDLQSLIYKQLPSQSIQNLTTLDYGCGAGRSTRYLKSLGINQVDGFDISASMIEQAKGFDPTGNYEQIDSAMIPVADDHYDLALMSFVTVAIDRKSEITQVFQEISRVLKPGGIFLSLTLSETFWNPQHKWMIYTQDYPENYYPKSGQKSRLTITSVNLELTDIYWEEKDIIDCAKEAHLALIEIHHPLGKKEDGIEWLDENKFAPYTIFCFKNSPY